MLTLFVAPSGRVFLITCCFFVLPSEYRRKWRRAHVLECKFMKNDVEKAIATHTSRTLHPYRKNSSLFTTSTNTQCMPFWHQRQDFSTNADPLRSFSVAPSCIMICKFLLLRKIRCLILALLLSSLSPLCCLWDPSGESLHNVKSVLAFPCLAIWTPIPIKGLKVKIYAINAARSQWMLDIFPLLGCVCCTPTGCKGWRLVSSNLPG